jgi:DNA-binding NarL/FixJ family response regulator
MTPTPPVRLHLPLTPRQREAVRWLAEAPSYKQLARLMGCTPRTAEEHVTAIAMALPGDFAPDATPRDRAIIYAVRCWVESQTAPAPTPNRQAA